MKTEEKLDLLFSKTFESEQINAKFDVLRKEIPVPEIPPEIQKQLADIELQRVEALATLEREIESLNAEIKQDTLGIGSTVDGKYMMAVWNKGRETWDGKLLNGFAIAHPEILSAKKVGDPSVTIRKKTVKEE